MKKTNKFINCAILFLSGLLLSSCVDEKENNEKFLSVEDNISTLTSQYENELSSLKEAYENKNSQYENELSSLKEAYESKTSQYEDKISKLESDISNLTNQETYTVTFNLNDGRDSFSTEVLNGNLITKPNDPSRAGYNFEGWYTESGEKWAFSGFIVKQDITLTAKWSVISKYHNIIVDFDGKGGEQPVLTTYTTGTSVVLTAHNDNEKYSFSHWEMLTLDQNGNEVWKEVSKNKNYEIVVGQQDAYYRAVWQTYSTNEIIPSDVLNANIEIDLAIYVEGQNRVIKDIGNYSPDPNDMTKRYHPIDIASPEIAKYFGAASKFKEIAPNVKINLIFCSINEYNEMIRSYYEQYGHLPELMLGTDSVVEMLENGRNFDLNRYSQTQYYKLYNEYFLSRFNYGGFQAAFPINVEPWGVFVNMDTLKDYSIVTDLFDENGLCSQEYKDWVDNFTWDSFVNAINVTTNETHAGLSKMNESLLSYSLPQVNNQFIREGTVNLTSPEVSQVLQKLLNYENEISQKCIYEYNEWSTGTMAKDAFFNAAGWRGAENFVKDEYSTFYTEAPWDLKNISNYVHMANKANSMYGMPLLDTHVDFLPYPKVNENSPAYTGIVVEGLTVGNQCPVGTVCTDEKMLKMDVAAYFAMFMGLDPRAIEGQAEVKYFYDGNEQIGHISLPLAKRGNKFSFQEGETSDPAYEYDDNWQYQLKLWFDIYDLYVTDGKPADIIYFSNITHGLVKMLDSMYMIEGIGEDYVTCLNFRNEPVNIFDVESTKDIFYNWKNRYTRYGDENIIGSTTYVANTLSKLSDIETEINTNSALAWSYLQECLDEYYGYDLYNVLDLDYRNNYEGSTYLMN